jgi:Domain of unknown function (DUF5667)
MRRQLLAGLNDGAEPAEPDEPTEPAGPEAEPAAGRTPARARSRVTGVRGRVLVAAAAALCLLVSLSAMSLLMARDALPGQALYGVKRSAESAELGLTFGAESRGFKHLQFATARIDELEALAAAGGPAVSSSDAGPYQAALEAFDAEAAAGSRLLTQAATSGNGSLLDALHSWAPQQSERIGALGRALPEQPASQAAESRDLLSRIAERATALRPRLGCQQVTSGTADDIGPLPAAGPCDPVLPGSGPAPPPSPTG